MRSDLSTVKYILLDYWIQVKLQISSVFNTNSNLLIINKFATMLFRSGDRNNPLTSDVLEKSCFLLETSLRNNKAL